MKTSNRRHHHAFAYRAGIYSCRPDQTWSLQPYENEAKTGTTSMPYCQVQQGAMQDFEEDGKGKSDDSDGG